MPVAPWRQWMEANFTFPAIMGSPTGRQSDRARKAQVFNQRLASAVSSWMAGHGLRENCRSSQEHSVAEWLRFGAWAQCDQCSVWYSRNLSQKDCRDSTSARSLLRKSCWHCARHGSRRDMVPQVCDAPLALRGLPPSANYVLRPLVVHQGNPKRHPAGYMRKDRMTSLSWKCDKVQQCIEALESDAERGALQEAYNWLRAHSAAYAAFIQEHERVLDAEERRNLKPSSILEPFLECALWPVLYYKNQLAESKLWGSTWERPFARQASPQPGKVSAKDLFVCKVCSGVAEYATNFELMQFQFDRHVLRTIIGGVGKLTEGADASMSLAHRHWGADYWKRHHRILSDISLQYGEPDLFLTVAPYEWSFPYPYWVEKLLTAVGGGPTDAPAAEVLAMAHALHQLAAGLLCGKTGDRWVSHLLADQLGTQHSTVRCYFARFEFQDGGREHCFGKGRGSLHLHMLVWLQNIRNTLLERQIQAELRAGDPDVSALAGLVQGSYDTESRTEQQSEPSHWTFDAVRRRWKLNLRCTAEFLAARLRPFLTSLLWLLRCHQDVQWCDSNGLLLRYVAGYVAKYSEGWSNLWLNSSSSSLEAGLSVLRCWRPSQAQMAMVLARASMAFTSAITTSYRPQCFWEAAEEKICLYRHRDGEEEGLSFLEWLRLKTFPKDAEGRLLAKHRVKAGLVAVGVEYDAPNRDQFYWQWLQLNVPHRLFTQLVHPDSDKVSPGHKHFASALLLCPDQWGSNDWVHHWLLRQGHRADYIETVKADLRARAKLVAAQIAGSVPKYSVSSVCSAGGVLLTPAQEAVLRTVLAETQKRTERPDDIQGSAKPLFITGGPGTGKSVTCQAIIKQCVEQDQSVLVASPTGRLACDVSYPEGVLSTTLHRAFGINPLGRSDDFDFVAQFDVWLINEVGMVDATLTDHILAAWHCLGRWPILVFEGDFQQLPPPTAQYRDPRESEHWQVRTLLLKQQQRCEDDKLLQFQCRSRSHPLTEAEVQAFWEPLLVSDSISEEALHQAWAQLPEAVVLTATRHMAEQINLVAQQKFAGEYLAKIPVWVGEERCFLDLHYGARIMLTRNGDLADGFCHGAVATVLAAGFAYVLVDMRGRVTSLHLRSTWILDAAGHSRLRSAFDISLAYAFTVHKVQGATLKAAIICFEDWCCEAWGYSAVTRVRLAENLRAVGRPAARHFQPRA